MSDGRWGRWRLGSLQVWPILLAAICTATLSPATRASAQERASRVVWTFGSLTEAKSALGGVSSIAELPSGRVVVVDQRTPAVWVLESDGSLSTRFGRSGRGPGEYIAPTEVFISHDTIVVSDYREQRQTLLDAQGDVRGTRALPRPVERTARAAWPTRHAGWYVEIPGFVYSTERPADGRYLLLWAGSSRIDTIAAVPSGHVVGGVQTGSSVCSLCTRGLVLGRR